MNTERILNKVYNVQGLCNAINIILYDMDNSGCDLKVKFSTVMEISKTLNHKINEVKNDITKLDMAQ